MAYTVALPDGRTVEFPDDVSKDKAAALIRQQFPGLGAPETTAFGQVKEGFKGIVPGAVGLLESAATGASALLPEDMEKSAREKIKSLATAAKEPFAASAGYEDTVGRKLGEAVGSTVPFLAAGPLGLAGRAAAVGLGVGAGAGESRTRAEEAGATGEQRSTATALGILPGALEAFAPMRILSRIPTASKAAGVEAVKRALVAGGEEAAQEAASGFAQNLIAKGVYKPEQALIEGLGEQAAYGGATGALVQGLMDLALGRRARGAKTTPTAEQPPAPEAPAPETPAEKPLQLGAAPPFVPRALPDGSVAMTQAELDAYEEQTFKNQYKPQPVRPPEQLTLPGMEGLAPAAPTDLFGAPLPRAEDEAAPRPSDLIEGVPLTTDVLRDAGMAPSRKEAADAGQQTLGLRRTPEGMPTASGQPEQTITSADIMLTAIPVPKNVVGWLEQNVVGSTPTQLEAMIAKDPTLVQGNTPRAKILRVLSAKEVPAFKEAPSVKPTPTETPATEQRVEPGAGEPSMGVPSEPAPAERAEPGAGVPTTAGAPVTPDGLGLVSAGQPAVPGAGAKVGKPTAVSTVQAGAPDVDSIKSFPVGPSRVTPTVLARGKPTYHETNADGLEDLARYDKQFEYSGAFVSDTADLALGQGANAGVFIEFRPNSVSGKRHDKLGTSAATGQEYKTDVVAPKAISVVTVKNPAAFKPGRATARLLRAEFDKVTLADGSVQYTRKNTTASKTLPITWAPEKATAPKAETPATVGETAEEEAARKAEAEAVKRQLEQVDKTPRVAPKAAPAPAPKAEKPKGTAPIPEKLYEPVGTSEIGMEEGQKELLRGPQSMLFPMSKREEIEYAERPRPEAEEETKPTAAKDERQAELNLTTTPAWAEKAAKSNSRYGTVVYTDGDIALVKYANTRNGTVEYSPAISTLGDYLPGDISTYSSPNGYFTEAQMDALRAAKAKAVAADLAASAKYPDGVFTGATSNVVAGDTVAPKYQKYLEGLTKAMGLGDVRIFMYHAKDAQALSEDPRISGPFYNIMARANPSEQQKGAVINFGPGKKDFMLFVKDGMSEAETLETISHEYGHLIQKVAFDNAPANVRLAIKKDYEDWVTSLKGKKVRDMVFALRNRGMAEQMDREGKIPDMDIAKMKASDLTYWMGFSEWLADNTSRWATTADKPLTITEKFFSKVAQLMRDLVAVVSGRKFPPNKLVAEFLDAMGPGSADTWLGTPTPAGKGVQPLENAVSFSTEQLVESMGPLELEQKSGLQKLIPSFKAGMSPAEPDYAVKFRTQVADSAATIEHRLREQFDGAVKDKLGKLNPMGLYRQAQDYSKMLLEYFQVGAISKEPATGLWKVKADPAVRPPLTVYTLIDKWAAKNGYTRERGTQIASRVLEGARLDAMRTSNKNDGTEFLLHLKDAEIDQLMREYNADPDLKAMSKAMDEARIAMINNMVAVGRLSAEQGKAWSDVAGYVPFDRIEDFASSFSKIKKISNKGLAQVGKLPELVGSINRPVGNVFDNYLNTLGWMVGQTLKTDGTVQTLRSLEDAGHAKFLGRSPQGKDNTVGMFVKGEMMYWELPSKYDVLAFKDLNPPKAKWLQVLGQASNVLRKAVTVLPPFALKQVTDDVQRAIMTSGVKNPGALLRMTLSNFGGLALAELRGIRHPTVSSMEALGLTGEHDFQQGKPAISVLKDAGYKPRGKFETLLHRLDGITRASDLAVRKAIYDQTLLESSGDQLLAQTRAREFINFRRRGASDFVGAMVTTIPFFNAYIQGMDVLYRAASGKDSSSSVGRAQARRMFWGRAAIAMTLSSLYAMGADDDEDYREMDLRIRDSNWILPGGFKLPVPGELGALFKVIPERVVEYMRRQGTPEEQTAWEATRTALRYIMEQYVGRTVPVPQGVKPLLEAWTNYSFFTGRELEGIYQKQQDPSLRRASNTSELAIAISEFSRDVVGVDKISPIMIDNALSGYFGSTAGLLVAMTDSLLNPTRVDRPLHKWALVSNYMYDPVGTRRMTEFYEEREKVGRANTTLNELMKTDLDKAVEYAESHKDELMLESAVNSTLNQLENTRAYRKYLNSAEGAKVMSKEERESQLKEIRELEVGLTGWLREAKTAMR